MWFMNWIISGLNSIGDWFYSLYLWCYWAIWPLSALYPYFYYLSVASYDLAWDFYYFSGWVDDVVSKVANILSWSTIWSYILSYVPNLTTIRDWFYGWWSNVQGVVTSWWSSTQWTVQSWISSAQYWLQSQLNSLTSWVTSIQSFINELVLDFPDVSAVLSWFSNWWGNVLTNINTWWNERLLDVQGLINSAFLLREGFWSGWQDWRSKVAEFFTDPIGFIWQRFTDWFLGPEG